MSTVATQPVPKNLRQQMVEKIQDIPDKYLAVLYEAFVHAEKVRLLDEISRDAESEQAEGKWENLPDLIREVREKIKAGRLEA
jgi:hypothetical protein